MLFIGVDLGTSSLKLLLCDENGTLLNTAKRDYPLIFPHPGWSEQRPEDWWTALLDTTGELLQGYDPKEVAGIGCGGQMHGLVLLDKEDNVLRPAILWNDGRTQEETDYLNEVIGKEFLSANTANIAFAGFTAPKILWVRKHEPEIFDKIEKIMLPKDYLNYCLTGVHATEYSDASGMLLLDVKNKTWSKPMLDICGVKEEMMPKLFESYEVIGTVKPEIASKFGFTDHVKVVGGAGDNAAAAIGTGTVGEGACNISLGTSGTIFISSDYFALDPYNALHAFAHADGHYHLMGCMLSAASCNKWLMDAIYQTEDYNKEQEGITTAMLGKNHVYFLPYLMGERSPLNDTNARAAFIGMTMDSSREDLTLAVLEGVSFAIRDSFEVAKALNIPIAASKLCGGGAKSRLWREILANILNISLEIPAVEEGPGYGGAMLAMVGCGLFTSPAECCKALVKTAEVVAPNEELAALYEERYQKFRLLYPALKNVFPKLQ